MAWMATLECLNVTVPPLVMILGTVTNEGLTTDLTQSFNSQWIRPLRGPMLTILFCDLSICLPYPMTPWSSMDYSRARETHKPEQDAQHHSFRCAINNAVMPIVWLTRYRNEPWKRDRWWLSKDRNRSPMLRTLDWQQLGIWSTDQYWCSLLECSRNDTFLALRSARVRNPLDTWKPYIYGLSEASGMLGTDNKPRTDLIWTLSRDKPYLFIISSLCIKTLWLYHVSPE